MNKHISKDISHYFTRRFLLIIAKVIAFVSALPIIFSIAFDIKFDPAQAVNIYLSTVCTSLFIAFTLQGIELYRTILVGYQKLGIHLTLISSKLEFLETCLNENQLIKLRSSAEILEHYRTDILKLLISNAQINEGIITLFQKDQFQIIREILIEKSEITLHEKNLLLDNIAGLKMYIKTLKDSL